MQNQQPIYFCRRGWRAAAIMHLTCAAILMPTWVMAQTAEPVTEQPVDVEVFQAAHFLSMSGDFYPRSELAGNREGWVYLNMMIDPQGTPYEITVLESSGNPALERAAVAAAKATRFSPALQGNTPIDSSLTAPFKFEIHAASSGASSQFTRKYRSFARALKTNDRAEADKILPTLKGNNLYEQAYEHYARFGYFERWGTPAEQLDALTLAVANAGASGSRQLYLPSDTFARALASKFALEVKTQDYSGALNTWSKLEPRTPEENR
ncbi:MAG: TonB family protein, partial [Nevskiaceae bacterium]|nr:TonB family protein [Nevskiaceae bacterium]